jgi:hypothetical protein
MVIGRKKSNLGQPIEDFTQYFSKEVFNTMGGKRKKPGNVGLPSSQVEGQGTTSAEIDGKSISSSRKRTKRN